MNILTIVQARLESTRLPRKILMDMGDGHTMLWHVISRAEQIGYPVIIALPDHDQELAAYCAENHWAYEDHTRAPADNVLKRYYTTARLRKADHIIRVTSDCPFLDVEAAKHTVQHHLDSKADYTVYEAEGRGVEVMTMRALDHSVRNHCPHVVESHAPAGMYNPYQEHVTEWIRQHPWLYRIEKVKFSVDTLEDLELARRRLAYGQEVDQKCGEASWSVA